jgi:hypothetical protein
MHAASALNEVQYLENGFIIYMFVLVHNILKMDSLLHAPTVHGLAICKLHQPNVVFAIWLDITTKRFG